MCLPPTWQWDTTSCIHVSIWARHDDDTDDDDDTDTDDSYSDCVVDDDTDDVDDDDDANLSYCMI